MSNAITKSLTAKTRLAKDLSQSAETAAETVGTKPKHRSPTVRKRTDTRMERFRDRKSTDHTATEHKKIFDKLMFGYNIQEDAINALQIISMPRTIVVPVSTRAVGFMVLFLFAKFARLKIKLPTECSMYRLYRLTLLQFELKVMQAKHEHLSRATGGKLFSTLQATFEQVQTVSELGAQFAPLANLVNSVGVFKGFNTQYLPRFAAAEIHDGLRVPEPTTVTFSNLREVVMMLSLRTTPVSWRKYFYDRNPLPGAKWGGRRQNRRRRIRVDSDEEMGQDLEDDFPVLLNPDDFMPEGYSDMDLHDDVIAFEDLLEAVGRKFPKYVHIGRIDFKSTGSGSMLVSNDPTGIRCSDLRFEDGEVQFGLRTIEGEFLKFWSPEYLAEPEFYMGIHHL